jgi:hypothetical protein
LLDKAHESRQTPFHNVEWKPQPENSTKNGWIRE